MALAVGVRERLGATYGLGVTGVAGPDEQEGKAAGTVHAAVAGPDGVVTRSARLPGCPAARLPGCPATGVGSGCSP